MKLIPFNKPFLTGKETEYIRLAVESGKISGDGVYTSKCHRFFEEQFKFQKALLTTSCTDALEMAAILANIQPGDEVIAPSFTFVSTVNAFVLRGAKIVFADSKSDFPNLDEKLVESLITKNTKAIVPVHYAGAACEMNSLLDIAKRNNLFLIEDAAQAFDSYYNDKHLGTFGEFGAFSFHETKNIISGEGGLLSINRSEHNLRSEIIREKGTNRSAFFRGEVDKYGWVDIGSSFLPSEIIAAFLYAQIENYQRIQEKRKKIWNFYHENLKDLENKGVIKRMKLPSYSTNNAHMYFIECDSIGTRTQLLNYLKENGVYAVFHYLSLHKSPFYIDKHDGRELKNSDHFSDCLVRLPLYYELEENQQRHIVDQLYKFYS